MLTPVLENSFKLLKDEIEITLGRIQNALERYMDEPDGADALIGVGELVDQIRGGFAMLEQAEATALCKELGAVVTRLQSPGFDAQEQAREAILRAVLLLPRYLDWMQREGDKPEFDLEPVIGELQAVYMDPVAGDDDGDQTTERSRSVARAGRSRLQRALLMLLRGTDTRAALRQSGQVFAELVDAVSVPKQRRLWEHALAVTREVESGALELNLDVHRLLRDLDQQLRREAEPDGEQGRNGARQRLHERLAGALARTADGQAYLLQAERESRARHEPRLLDVETLLQIAGHLKESLALVHDAIDRFARDPAQQAEVLAGQSARVHDIGNVLSLLNLHVPARMARRARDSVQTWLDGDTRPTERALMPLALDLSLVESSLESMGDAVLADRLGAATDDETGEADCRRLLADFDYMRSRRALVAEATAALHGVREVLIGRVDDPAWEAVAGEIAGVAAAFALLGHPREFGLGRQLGHVVEAMRQRDWTAGDGDLSSVADVIVALEYGLGAAAEGREADADLLVRANQRLQEVASHLGMELSAEELEASPVAPHVSAPSEEAAPQATPWMVDAPAIAAPEPSLAHVTTGDASAMAYEGLPKADELEQQPSTRDEPDSVTDAEFVQVFFEEAEGEVAGILEAVAQWRERLERDETLNAMRRSFHTMKGSGRMVGEATIGDFSWHFERLLNGVLEAQLAPSADIADLVEGAARQLQGIVRSGAVTPADAEGMKELETRANALWSSASAVPDDAPEPEEVELGADGDGWQAPESVHPAAVAVTEEPESPAPESVIEAEQAWEPMVPVDPGPAEHVPGAFDYGEPPPAVPAHDASAQPLAVDQRPVPEADPELVEVFLEEAAEVLDHSDNVLQIWREDPADLDVLNDLRRAMHTLKGSSRMAGFAMIGNLAHASESLLDAVAAGEITAGDPIFTALQHVLDELSAMASRARSGVRLAPDETLLQSLFDMLAHGHERQGDDGLVPGQPLPATRQDAVLGVESMDRDLVQVFEVEAADILQASDEAIRAWTSDLANRERLSELRRAMHTLKGSSRMAGFGTMGDAAHAMESVLDAVAGGRLTADSTLISELQWALDRIADMLAEVRDAGRIPAMPAGLAERLAALLGGDAEAPVPQPGVPRQPQPAVRGSAALPLGEDSIRVNARLLNNLFDQMGESSIFRARVDQGVGALRFGLNELDQTVGRLRSQLRRLEIETETQILFRYEEGRSELHAEFDPLELDRFSELQQLSRSLMEIVDDLNNVQHTLEDQTQEMTFLLDQQAKINKVIQENLMRTRMVKFSTVIPRLRRVVRQAAQELDKQAELVIEGESDLDRTVLENMVAPLEHLLRNSISHGIESPGARSDAGKPETGVITIRLHREGAELVLVVEDDGAGLDFEAIRAKGVSTGLLRPTQRPTEPELVSLLLRPGFSTAREVTQISGRGVGMDVVHETIRSMRGTLNIQSRRLRGASFIVRLPFSLAVTQALLVEAGGETYAIPMLSVEAVSRLNEGEFESYLRGDAVSHEYSGRRYNVHSLAALFGSRQLRPATDDPVHRPAAVLCHSGEASAALQVDAVVGNQEIIVKPLGRQLHRVPGISGATVLGDGRVVVVLELAALVRNLASEAQRDTEKRALRELGRATAEVALSAMVIDDSITMRKVTGRILERNGIRVAAAKDGLEAVAMLEDNPPELVILDIEMPRMDGFEVLAHIRNQPHLRALKVIMVTSRSGEKHRERAKRLGVDDYLIKPYQEEELMRSVRSLLGERARHLVN